MISKKKKYKVRKEEEEETRKEMEENNAIICWLREIKKDQTEEGERGKKGCETGPTSKGKTAGSR